MRSIWKFLLRSVVVFATYGFVGGIIGLFRCGFPQAGLIGTGLIGLIGWGALIALNPDKSRRSFPPRKGVEQILVLGGAIFGIVVGITGKWC